MNFIHLHLHSEHSLLDGYGKAEQYANKAKELGQTSLGITDHGNVDGLIKFQRACTKAGITPVLGCELYIVPDLRKKEAKEKRYHITCLIQNEAGFQNLLKMLSIANLEGHHYWPRIDPQTLLGHREGLVFMSACVSSFLFMDGGLDLLLELRKDNPMALEIMPHDIQAQKDANLAKVRIATQFQIPLVATNDCHYPLAYQAKTQEMLLAIQRKKKWADPDRWRFGFDGLHLRSTQEMMDAFKKQGVVDESIYLQAMENTMAVAELCKGFRIEKRPVELPKAHGYEDRDETELMWEIVNKGFEERIVLGPEQSFRPYEIWINRINEEMNQICQMEFQRYFLIVWELISWCHKKGILTGPGRGSVGGSLVAYLMYLTDVDPIKYGLIFARFISPERNDFPDIDMDFPQDRREEVRQHLNDCYGQYNVASITTFLTMKGSMALRDVARVFDLSGEVDKPAKSIVDKPDGDPRSGHTIEDSLRESQELRQFRDRHPEAVALAMELEGQARGHGKHAAAACISAEDLREGRRCNLAMREGVLTANWDKGDAEYMGLMKLDVLGLSTLSVLNYARELIKESGTTIEFDKIPLDDPGVYRELAAGHCIGGFQLGTNLLIRLCKELEVREFNDIVLVNALSRPGPLGSGITDEFIARRRGQRPVIYIHPRLRPYTDYTLGMIIYQEQVMWAMYELAGLPWGVCDKVRKVMGKSKGAAEFQQFKAMFVEGCTKQGTLTGPDADHVWDQLSSFGSYGFNLAHAVEYSMIGYWTMYLKCKWPKQFMAALLTYGGEKHKAGYVAEARRRGLRIGLPRIGLSSADKWVPGTDNSLLAPFTEIKGVGAAQAGKIVNGGTKAKSKPKDKKPKKIFKGFFEPIDEKQYFIDVNAMPEETKKAAIDDILYKVGADGRAMTEAELQEAQQYFSFNIMDKAGRFSRLILSDPALANVPEADLISCNITANLLRIRKYIKKVEGHTPHVNCELREQCRRPVNPSIGRYNVMAAGEAPGPDEDLQGLGFVGRAGTDVLWPEFRKYGLSPLMFHITNICKCFPGKVKTPGKRHIEACRPILEDEIRGLEPVVVLAFGNTGNQFFRGMGSGISDLSGTTEWSDRHQCWVCFCSHPASVLHGGSRSDFERGIRNFAEVLGRLGGKNQGAGQVPQTGTCPYKGRWGIDNNNFLECEVCQSWVRCATAASYGDWKGL